VSEPEVSALFRVVRGRPTDEEIAALVVVLTARRPADTPAARPQVSPDGWAARWRGLRTSLRPGPGAWRLSGRG